MPIRKKRGSLPEKIGDFLFRRYYPFERFLPKKHPLIGVVILFVAIFTGIAIFGYTQGGSRFALSIAAACIIAAIFAPLYWAFFMHKDFRAVVRRKIRLILFLICLAAGTLVAPVYWYFHFQRRATSLLRTIVAICVSAIIFGSLWYNVVRRILAHCNKPGKGSNRKNI